MIEKIQGKDHLVQKKDGRLEKYSPTKMKKAINRQTNNKEYMTNTLFEALNIKLYNKIKVEKLWDEVIETAANMISELQPGWDEVAKNAYLQKIYKETYNIHADIDKLNYMTVIKKGVTAGVYSREIAESFTEEEIHELGDYIKKERDKDFTFVGLVSMMEKYSFNASQTKKLELPQHVYMRLAIFPFWKEENKSERLSLIKQRYDDLSTHVFTEATPKMINSMTNNTQMASCVLSTVDDNIESISQTDTNIALFSKYGGGLAIDASYLRCSGSPVGKMGGKSTGPIQFIKKFESTVGAFDQMGKRKGACVVTFPFWHMDVKDLIMLKDAGGAENKRARGFVYAIKWYKLLSQRIKSNEDITLFDPKDVLDLNELWGDNFTKQYEFYENKTSIRKKRISARELAFLIAKVRSETGNVYITFVDNINNQRIGESPVFNSNLCQEIVLPNYPAENFKSKLQFDFNGKATTKSDVQTGEIALCNLSSVNLSKWRKLTNEQKRISVYNLLRASDNLIDIQFYPVKDGELSNKRRRPIAIGINNYANDMASQGIKFSDVKALKYTHEVMEDITYYILEGSNILAQERGHYNYFKDSKWADGIVPMDLYLMKDDEKYNFKLKHNWNKLKKNIKETGVRFSYHFAIAPTATSGLIINSTEGIDPVRKLFTMKEGTYTLPQIVPNLRTNRMFYENAFDIDTNVINDLASIRQKFLDQAQSVSHFYKITDSAYKIISDILDAEKKGIKTLYYLHPLKAGDVDSGCESCSS